MTLQNTIKENQAGEDILLSAVENNEIENPFENCEPKNNILMTEDEREWNQFNFEKHQNIAKNKKRRKKKLADLTEAERHALLIKSRGTIIRETIENFFSDSLVKELQQIQTLDEATKEGLKDKRRIEDVRNELLLEIQREIQDANSLRKKESADEMQKLRSFDFPEAKEILKQFNDFRVIKLHEEATHQNSLLCRFNEKKQIFEDASQYIENFVQCLTEDKIKPSNKEHPVYVMLKNEILTLTEQFQDPDFVPCKNGLYNTKTKELLPYSKERVILNPFETNYNPEATNPEIEMPDGEVFHVENDFFKPLATTEDGFFDREIYDEMWKSVSLGCQPWTRYDRAFMLYSPKGANGKGTFMEMMRAVVGGSLSKTLDISQFAKDDQLKEIIGARLVLGDENSVNEYLKKLPKFKACVTGDPVTISVKYKDAMTFSFDGKIFQCLNSLPSTADKSKTLSRRFLFIPFMNCFLHNDNKKIKGEYIKDERVREYILKKALDLNVKDIPESEWPRKTKEILDLYELENDSLLSWWNDFEPEFQEESHRRDKDGTLDCWDNYDFHFFHDIFNQWCKNGGTGSGRDVSLKYQTFVNEFILKIYPKLKDEFMLPNNDSNRFSTTKAMKEKPNRLLLTYTCDSLYKGIPDKDDLHISDWEKGIRGNWLKSSHQGIVRR